jgi:hypothetical protein
LGLCGSQSSSATYAPLPKISGKRTNKGEEMIFSLRHGEASMKLVITSLIYTVHHVHPDRFLHNTTQRYTMMPGLIAI